MNRLSSKGYKEEGLLYLACVIISTPIALA